MQLALSYRHRDTKENHIIDVVKKRKKKVETLIEMEGHVQIESDKEHGENLGWISPELVDEYRAQFTASGCNASGCDVTLTTLDKNTMQA